jgi:hypothetical protein
MKNNISNVAMIVLSVCAISMFVLWPNESFALKNKSERKSEISRTYVHCPDMGLAADFAESVDKSKISFKAIAHYSDGSACSADVYATSIDEAKRLLKSSYPEAISFERVSAGH